MEYMDQTAGIRKLVELIYDKNLVPVFGAGFSMGSICHNGNVPNAIEATRQMKDIILSANKNLAKTDIEDDDFFDTADLFISEVSIEKRRDYFKNYYTEANLPELQRNFLTYSWSYAYTLNIDDAIERTNIFHPVLPYRKLTGNLKNGGFKLLYKLHGDALTEVQYDDVDENIVFGNDQYMKALNFTENKNFLDNIAADYQSSNMLFIGCSLEKEQDLSYVYARCDGSVNTLRIFLTDKKPDPKKELLLSKKYGINLIMIVDDYNSFYLDLDKIMKQVGVKDLIAEYKYKNPKFISYEDNIKKSIELITGMSIFDLENNAFMKSGLQIIRESINEIKELLKETDCILIKGRRFSGKTFLLSSFIYTEKSVKIFFFPTATSIDAEIVLGLFENNDNSYFIFDSNSISKKVYQVLVDNQNQIKDKGNKLIIAVNSDDNFLMDNLNGKMVELQRNFTGLEADRFARCANRYGLIKRQKNLTNFDYLFRLSKQNPHLSVLKIYEGEFSFNEQVILLILAAEDKLFFGDALAIGISQADIENIKTKLPKVIEDIPVEASERERHSGRKLVHNSKYILMSFLNKLSEKQIVECIQKIVKELKGDKERNRIYVDIILFDTLNQLFFEKSGGAGGLIFRVYDVLEEILNDDMHYWLQRAKSVYRLNRNNKDQLEIAFRYANKAYCDGSKNLKPKAALTLSLICALLTEKENNQRERKIYFEMAISYGLEAVSSKFYYHKTYLLNNELKNGWKKNSNSYDLLMGVCKKYQKNYSDYNHIDEAEKLISNLEDIRDKFKYGYKFSVGLK